VKDGFAMNSTSMTQQAGLTTIEYVIGAASLVLFIVLVFSGMGTALISKLQSVTSSI